MTTWTFLTNHALVLLCITNEPRVRLRDIATFVGITERAAHRIVTELEEAGYLTRHRQGNRNHYEIHEDRPLRHPTQADHHIGELLRMLRRKPRRRQRSASATGSGPRDSTPTSRR